MGWKQYVEDRSTEQLFASGDNPTVRRCIDGTRVGCSRCVGYCRFEGHPGYLTAEHRQCHDCIGKGCRYYVEKPKKQRTACESRFDQSQRILSYAHAAIQMNRGYRVIRVEHEQENRYKAFFVTITNDYSFDLFIRSVKAQYDVDLKVERLNYDFDVSAAILCAG